MVEPPLIFYLPPINTLLNNLKTLILMALGELIIFIQEIK